MQAPVILRRSHRIKLDTLSNDIQYFIPQSNPAACTIRPFFSSIDFSDSPILFTPIRQSDGISV
jgi:hypothetical protein